MYKKYLYSDEEKKNLLINAYAEEELFENREVQKLFEKLRKKAEIEVRKLSQEEISFILSYLINNRLKGKDIKVKDLIKSLKKGSNPYKLKKIK